MTDPTTADQVLGLAWDYAKRFSSWDRAGNARYYGDYRQSGAALDAAVRRLVAERDAAVAEAAGVRAAAQPVVWHHNAVGDSGAGRPDLLKTLRAALDRSGDDGAAHRL